ncbi:MAG: hypothetical protein F9K44_03705 [Hyphomicrobiaceae bacterium]|nr:MAG: hypothetical protein F9K44_03705 [Hyphomicrobiaceae bacterium]
MAARYLFLGGLAAATVVTAIRLLPGDLERVSQLERDGRFEAAMAALDRLHATGNRDPRIALSLYKLKVHFGELDRAQALIEEYARARPRDTQAQLGLVRFYQQTHQPEPYIGALRQLWERTRSAELQKELVGFYRLDGRFAEEEEVLERASRTGRATTADLERLGLLAAGRGDLQRAARALRRADRRLDARAQQSRLSLFAILLALKEHEEAFERSATWLKSWQSQDATLGIMEDLAEAGRADLAIALSARFGGSGSEVTLIGAEMLAEANRIPELKKRLAEYVERGLPETREPAARFISLSVAAGELETALKAARNIGLKQLPADTVADLLEALSDLTEDGEAGRLARSLISGFAAEIEGRLEDSASRAERDQLILAPRLLLYTAQLAVSDNNRDLARRLLLGIDPAQLPLDRIVDFHGLSRVAGIVPHLDPALLSKPTKRSLVPPRRNRLLVRRQQKPKDPPPSLVFVQPAPSSAVEPVDPKLRRLKARERQLQRIREARRAAAARRSEQRAAQQTATQTAQPRRPAKPQQQ